MTRPAIIYVRKRPAEAPDRVWGKRKDSSPKTREVTDADGLADMLKIYRHAQQVPVTAAWERWSQLRQSSTTSADTARSQRWHRQGRRRRGHTGRHRRTTTRRSVGLRSAKRGTTGLSCRRRRAELWPATVDKIKVPPTGQQRTVQVKDSGRADAFTRPVISTIGSESRGSAAT